MGLEENAVEVALLYEPFIVTIALQVTEVPAMPTTEIINDPKVFVSVSTYTDVFANSGSTNTADAIGVPINVVDEFKDCFLITPVTTHFPPLVPIDALATISAENDQT